MTRPISRGDVVLTRFPFTDLTGSAVRPALVVSNGRIGNDVVLAGISSVLRSGAVSTDLIIDLAHPEFSHTGLRVASVVRLHKLAAVELKILVRRMGQVGPQLQRDIDRLLREVLGL